jgi:hypothetical protein
LIYFHTDSNRTYFTYKYIQCAYVYFILYKLSIIINMHWLRLQKWVNLKIYLLFNNDSYSNIFYVFCTNDTFWYETQGGFVL